MWQLAIDAIKQWHLPNVFSIQSDNVGWIQNHSWFKSDPDQQAKLNWMRKKKNESNSNHSIYCLFLIKQTFDQIESEKCIEDCTISKPWSPSIVIVHARSSPARSHRSTDFKSLQAIIASLHFLAILSPRYLLANSRIFSPAFKWPFVSYRYHTNDMVESWLSK